jgi:hypothetical protein
MNNEFEIIWKGLVKVKFKALSWHFYRWAEENCENLSEGNRPPGGYFTSVRNTDIIC